MNLSENAKRWASAILIFAALLAWVYMAGVVFMVGVGGDYRSTTPLTFPLYAYHYGEQKQYQNWLFVGALVASAPFFGLAYLIFRPRARSLHGEARLASLREIEKAGLTKGRGILVGKLGGKYLTYPGAQHVFVAARTRGGKGVSLVIPNLLHWPDSVVVLDIKQENFDLTSGFRKKHGQKVFLFNPLAVDKRSHRWNPLAYVSDDPAMRVDHLQRIAAMLFEDVEGTDRIWTATPRTLFIGVALYLMETPGKLVTLGQIRREMAAEGDGAAYFERIIKERQESGKPLSGACVRSLTQYTSIASEKTRSGVHISFMAALELWENPLLDAATSGNDFDLRNLRRERMSVYLGVTPDNLSRLSTIIRLFFQQLIDLNTQTLPEADKTLKHQVLLLMDEFTAPGKIPIFEKGVAFIAGYGLRLMPIIQSYSQLNSVYGKDAANTMQANHALRIVFAPHAGDIESARDISEALGYTTVKSISVSKRAELFARPNPSHNESDQRRALFLPQELVEMGQDKVLLLLENTKPIIANKAYYYNDNTFIERLKMVSPLLAKIRGKPNHKQLQEAMMTHELRTNVKKLDIESLMLDIDKQNENLIVQGPADENQPLDTIAIASPVTKDDILSGRKINFTMSFDDIKTPITKTVEALESYGDQLYERIALKGA